MSKQDKKPKKGRENMSLIVNEELIRKQKEYEVLPEWKKAQLKITETMQKNGVTTEDIQKDLIKLRKEMNEKNE